MPQQRPKKQDNVEGRTIIARNVNWKLPAYLGNAIESPFAKDRLAALDGLTHLYLAGRPRRVLRPPLPPPPRTRAAERASSTGCAGPRSCWPSPPF
jgi:hypothetical protein